MQIIKSLEIWINVGIDPSRSTNYVKFNQRFRLIKNKPRRIYVSKNNHDDKNAFY